jgi:hypothetical protein
MAGEVTIEDAVEEGPDKINELIDEIFGDGDSEAADTINDLFDEAAGDKEADDVSTDDFFSSNPFANLFPYRHLRH